MFITYLKLRLANRRVPPTPATLATIVSTVPEGQARSRALAIFTGVITEAPRSSSRSAA